MRRVPSGRGDRRRVFAGLSGAGAWFLVVSGRVLVRVLLVGFWWRVVGEARRITVRF
jgi:hypothetical protein